MSEKISYLQALESSKPVEVPKKNQSVEVLTSEDVVIDGVQVRRAIYAVDDPEHRFDGLKADDFSLTNQIAAGVDLKHSLCCPSNFAAADALVDAAQRLYVMSESSKTE